MQQVVIPQERNSERITEQIVDAPLPQVMGGIVESEYVAPALAVARRRRTVKGVASAPAVAYTAPAAVIEYLASSPAVTCAAPAPVIESHLPLLVQHLLQ